MHYQCNLRKVRSLMDSHLVVREELLAVEEDRIRGSKGYSVDEVAAMMRNAIKGAAGEGNEGVLLDKQCFTRGDAEAFKQWMIDRHPEIEYGWIHPICDVFCRGI